MGTRSLTHVKQAGATLVTIYRQFDGYPTGHGMDIMKALGDRTLVNGLSMNATKCVNGMGCAAATLIAYLKTDGLTTLEAGGFYIEAPDSEDCGEEYVYTIDGDTFNAEKGMTLKVESVYGEKVLYDGPLSEFDPFAAENIENEDE